MYRKRRHGVQLAVTHLFDLAARIDQRVGIFKRANHAVYFVRAQAKLFFYLLGSHFTTTSWPLNECFSCASTPFTSEIAIIGRKRANTRKSVRNNPKVPK